MGPRGRSAAPHRAGRPPGRPIGPRRAPPRCRRRPRRPRGPVGPRRWSSRRPPPRCPSGPSGLTSTRCTSGSSGSSLPSSVLVGCTGGKTSPLRVHPRRRGKGRSAEGEPVAGAPLPRTPECTWRPPVSVRRPVLRVLLGGALLSAGVLAVVGGLALGGRGLLGVGLATVLAGCTAAGIAREAPGRRRGSVLEAAVWAAGCTAGAVLVAARRSPVAGGAVAAVVVLAALAVVAVRWAKIQRRRTSATGQRGAVLKLPVGPSPAPSVGDRRPNPVSALSTRALGDEWVRTTAALSGRLS